MAVPYESFPIPGLEVFDPIEFEDKLRRFGNAGLNHAHGVFDFDLTLTAPTTEGLPISSWRMLENHLPPEARARCEELFHQYYPLERDGTMTVADAEAWWTGALEVQLNSRVNLNEVEADFVNQDTIRTGTRELFDFMARSDIPSIILSAGVKNVIDMWFKAYGLSASTVISTEFYTDENGYMTGWDKDGVVHVMNKGESAHPELMRLRSERPYVIVVGDSVHDADMAEGEDTVIRVRIIDDENRDNDEMKQLTERRFDGVIRGGDLFPIVALAQRIDAYSDAK